MDGNSLKENYDEVDEDATETIEQNPGVFVLEVPLGFDNRSLGLGWHVWEGPTHLKVPRRENCVSPS